METSGIMKVSSMTMTETVKMRSSRVKTYRYRPMFDFRIESYQLNMQKKPLLARGSGRRGTRRISGHEEDLVILD